MFASSESHSSRVAETKSQPWMSSTLRSRVICPAWARVPPVAGVVGLVSGAGKTWSRFIVPHSPDTSHWESGETVAKELLSISPESSGWVYS